MHARLAIKLKRNDDESFAVVVSKRKTNVYRNSIVYCVKFSDVCEDENYNFVYKRAEDFEGSPFRLIDCDGQGGYGCHSFIWGDNFLRLSGIEVGSIILVEKQTLWFQRNTGIKVDVDKILSRKRCRNGALKIGFHGIPKRSSDFETPELSAYPISSSPRGICFIVNNLCFEKESKNRYGGEKDEEALKELFGGELNFDIHVRNDLENLEMQRAAEEFAAKDHSDYDAFVCIIMSHGKERDFIEGVKGRKISIEDLMSEFRPKKCPKLAEKPKVFIIQACRGPKEDESMQSTTECTESTKDGFFTDSTTSKSVTPQESDFLLAFSTVPGYVSYRTPESGSLFIQTLVEVIRKNHKTEHLADMLTMVTRHVAEKGSQVPAPVSTLRYKLYL